MQGEMIRQKLLKGERVYATHVVSLGNPVAAALTSDLHIDAVFICTEHMPMDRTEVSMMCQFYASRGISPIVRIPYPDPRLATMYLDGGAQGIVAPYVETVDEVKALVGAVRYRPIKGELLDKFLSGAEPPSEKLQTFWRRFNRQNYLIIGFESVPAINRLEQLAGIDGVDDICLGPHDITCSMQIPEEYEHPRFVETVVDVIRRCRRMGRSVGIHQDLTAPASRPFLEAGQNLIFHLADVIKMRQTMNAEFAALRQSFGDRYARDAVAAPVTEVCIQQDAPTAPAVHSDNGQPAGKVQTVR